MTDNFLSLVKKNEPLAPYTTIQLGGAAQFFINCTSISELKFALKYAQDNKLSTHILGGGSNTVFPDTGFAGLVIRIAITGITIKTQGESATVVAAAGESWDKLVAATVARGLGGLENMSGIPGTVGAAPVQNIGAYGQDVSQVISAVTVIDQLTQQESTLTKAQCQLGYRTSCFKKDQQQRLIITGVTFKLISNGQPSIAYPDVLAEIGGGEALKEFGRGADALAKLRYAVLKVRRGKSMIIDAGDPHSRSCGSFFVNPILTPKQHLQLQKKTGHTIPTRSDGPLITVPAAWLVEQAGYPKGYRQDGVGISDHHNLALVNYGGTTASLLALANDIQAQVKAKFNLTLAVEPNII